ncbi:transcriptional regulator [Paraburkholderia caffeinilytica]|uniref:Transcriptional regulator n=1 Tax=Paraburkholderia caffeinilytica TaxID=1761016 RepID=A0ABQ1NB60_9BURK|nr:MerR family transcriptional regulator [Paraburkholderia caffeinilytica]AXL50859.1 transcriptional regulator [Paraburkholderia caffeinilytica]GGC66739.1 transcriptional regulator [Paraburkholderia caffeinilytica]CAB3803587.1 Mercuric resistance operon regulatory protein [Paraburkholderia caffeinilytica]
MRIGELAEKTGLAPSAIRFYEQSGLLPAPERSANGYRVYSDQTVGRLRMVQLAQNLGFPLDRLREAMTGDEQCPKEDLLHNLDTRLDEIEQLMTALRAQRKTLRTLRTTLSEAWAAGDCVDAAELADRLLAQQQEPLRRSKRSAR